MSNALRLEQMLYAGQFRSLADIRMTYGITRMVLAKTLDMLDHTPEKSPPSSGKHIEPLLYARLGVAPPREDGPVSA